MSWLGDVWDTTKNAIGDAGREVKGWLGGKMRSEGEYGGVDRGNFDVPGFDERNDYFRRQAEAAAGRQAPQVAESAFREDQRMVLDRLRRQMTGEDSLSQAQLRQNTDANLAQQRSLAAGASPRNAALSMRLLGQNAGRINQAAVGQQAMAGIAERNAAANLMGQVAQGARGQDLSRGQANAQNQLQQTGLNQQGQLGFGTLEQAGAEAQQRGGMGYEQNRTQRATAALGVPSNMEGVISAGMDIAKSAAMLSDERAKTDVGSGKDEADSFMDELEAKTFKYKQGVQAPSPAGPGTDVQGDPRRQRILVEGDSRRAPPAQTGGYTFRDVQGRTHFVETGNKGDWQVAGAVTNERMIQPGGEWGPAREMTRGDENPSDRTPKEYPYARPIKGSDLERAQGPEQLGIMAQDAEKSKLGNSLVQGGGSTLKTIQNVTPALLASIARLNERLRKVEGD